MANVTINTGGLVGGIIAMIMSWVVNHSVIWGILHFFCSWIYVIYWLAFKTRFIDWLEQLVK